MHLNHQAALESFEIDGFIDMTQDQWQCKLVEDLKIIASTLSAMQNPSEALNPVFAWLTATIFTTICADETQISNHIIAYLALPLLFALEVDAEGSIKDNPQLPGARKNIEKLFSVYYYFSAHDQSVRSSQLLTGVLLPLAHILMPERLKITQGGDVVIEPNSSTMYGITPKFTYQNLPSASLTATDQNSHNRFCQII